jgi:hypothetical protein
MKDILCSSCGTPMTRLGSILIRGDPTAFGFPDLAGSEENTIEACRCPKCGNMEMREPPDDLFEVTRGE